MPISNEYNIDLYEKLKIFTHKYETWHSDINQSDICLYDSLLRGRIEVAIRDDEVVGYAETWRITSEKVNKILNDNFSSIHNDIEHGNILWINAVSISEEFRNSDVIKELKQKVIEKNYDAQYAGGIYEGTRKRHKKVKLVNFNIWEKAHGR